MMLEQSTWLHRVNVGLSRVYRWEQNHFSVREMWGGVDPEE